MPSKIDSVIINNELLDKRVKLTTNQKQEIIYIREKQQISYQKLANMFGVSKRTIIFICKPETLITCLEKRKERGGWKQYYDKEQHSLRTKEHRDYKTELFKKNLI
jgi:hypothetical protein